MILLAKTSIKGEVTMWFTMYQNRERKEQIQELIREIHLFAKPNFSINFSRKIHTTLYYALLISSLRVMNPASPFLLVLR